jgi:hypothetical protein
MRQWIDNLSFRSRIGLLILTVAAVIIAMTEVADRSRRLSSG